MPCGSRCSWASWTRRGRRTLGGLGLINLAIPITIFIYTVIFRIGYFGMFNFLSFFLIMGIGVDDIFVFYDAWLQSAQHHRTLEARLDYAYRRSAHAMAVTSFTDAAAFYTNCLSSITVVKLFGAFMGTLVLVNFFLVVTAFPALIVVRYHLGLSRFLQADYAGALQVYAEQPTSGSEFANDESVAATAESRSRAKRARTSRAWSEKRAAPRGGTGGAVNA